MKNPPCHNISTRFRGYILRHAKLTVIITGLITLIFASALTRIRFENAPGKLSLPLDDPIRAQLDEFRSEFGANQIFIVGLRYHSALDSAAVGAVRELTGELGKVDGVISAYSITNAMEFFWSPAMGVYVLRPKLLVPKARRASDSAVSLAVQRLTENHMYRDNLISDDGQSTAIVLLVDPWQNTDESGLKPVQRLASDIKQTTAEVTAGVMAAHFAGPPVLDIALHDAMKRDLSTFAPLSIIALVIILMSVFRSWRIAAAGFLTALIALIWSLGILPLTGTPISLGLSMIVPLVLSLTLMYSVHYLVCVFRPSQFQVTPSRVTKCWRALLAPGLLCGVTTCVGFLSLGVSRLPGIREVGIFVGFGVIASTLLANVFLPAMLAVLGWQSPRKPTAGTGYLMRLIQGARRIVMLYPGRFSLIFVALCLAAGFGIRSLRVETNHLAYLANDREVSDSFRFVDNEFGGVLPLEVLVEVKRENAAEAVMRTLNLEEDIRALEGVGSVISAADFVYQAELAKPRRTVPLNPPLHLARQLIPDRTWNTISDRSVAGSYLGQSDSTITLRLSCRVHIGSSEHLRLLVSDVNALAAQHVSEYQTTVTGLAPYFARVARYVVSTQIESFTLAFIVTILMLGMLAGSVRIGLAIIGVNILPVIVVLGTMGWFSVPLDISTVMIASIAIGIVVDDTIHLMYRYRREMSMGRSVQDSLRTALEKVGEPVIATTIILAAGFASLLPARFVPTAYFGGLSALTVIVAGLADLFLLPALIMLLERYRASRVGH